MRAERKGVTCNKARLQPGQLVNPEAIRVPHKLHVYFLVPAVGVQASIVF